MLVGLHGDGANISLVYSCRTGRELEIPSLCYQSYTALFMRYDYTNYSVLGTIYLKEMCHLPIQLDVNMKQKYKRDAYAHSSPHWEK